MANQSQMIELGTRASDFSLPDPSGRVYSLHDFSESKALLVAFICNHCPFVKHISRAFAQFARDYQSKGLAIVAVSSNDIEAFPDDAPAKMAEFAKEQGFIFPYLFDESQKVALAYGAACTPDFFLFDAGRRLVYRGQFDGSRPHTEWDVRAGRAPNRTPADGADMRAAVDAVLAGRPQPPDQRAAAGCSIKWKPENEPAT